MTSYLFFPEAQMPLKTGSTLKGNNLFLEEGSKNEIDSLTSLNFVKRKLLLPRKSKFSPLAVFPP